MTGGLDLVDLLAAIDERLATLERVVDDRDAAPIEPPALRRTTR